jgi:RNA polymerase sigma factor (sigma-70 family)
MQQKQKDEDTLQHTHTTDATLYDRYGQAVFAYARLHTRSREEAEDVTLEVFIVALENDNLSGLADDERLAWLRRVAHNKCVDSYRSFMRRPAVALDQMVEKLLVDEAMAPEQLALQREMYERLYAVIRKLPLLQQQVLRLHYGDELRFTEIAVLLNKREEALRKLHSRALQTLRTTYNHHLKGGEQPC